MTGFHDPQLNIQQVPKGFESWVTLFADIRRGEGITYADIDAYERVRRHKLSAVQITALFAMDRGAASAMAELTKERKDAG